MRSTRKLSFAGSDGSNLSARLDLPAGTIRAFALFAHCFTCSKDTLAASRISGELARRGIAVLRFDFTGLGRSEGEFANTDFSSNVADLLNAAEYLRATYEAPRILVGHSLGGAAILVAAGKIPEIQAIATIGAPADVAHVLHNLASDLDRIEAEGQAEVRLAGRTFTIRKDFVEDVRRQSLLDAVSTLQKPLLILHAPKDQIVGIDNARVIYEAAKHPKSFIALDGADHLVTSREDAQFVAEMITAWASRYIEADAEELAGGQVDSVLVAESGEGKFQQLVRVGPHRFLADEPVKVGGEGKGPTPYDFVAIGLGACTAMTLRMYAAHKKLDLGRISVEVHHNKVHAADCEDCAAGLEGRIDRFERRISIEGMDDDTLRAKLLEIADKCPVHRTLETRSAIVTRFDD